MNISQVSLLLIQLPRPKKVVDFFVFSNLQRAFSVSSQPIRLWQRHVVRVSSSNPTGVALVV